MKLNGFWNFAKELKSCKIEIWLQLSHCLGNCFVGSDSWNDSHDDEINIQLFYGRIMEIGKTRKICEWEAAASFDTKILKTWMNFKIIYFACIGSHEHDSKFSEFLWLIGKPNPLIRYLAPFHGYKFLWQLEYLILDIIYVPAPWQIIQKKSIPDNSQTLQFE